MDHLHGFSFLEVLISFTLMSVILFGMDFVEVRSLQASMATYYFYRATLLSNQITEKLTIKNIENKNDMIREWQYTVQESLPEGDGKIEETDKMKLSISWGKKRIDDCNEIKIEKNGCYYVAY